MRYPSALAGLLLTVSLLSAKPPTANVGSLTALNREGQPLGDCPLQHTDVAVDIAGPLATVVLTQQFGNPFTEPIEAVYTFPMSDRAAIYDMLLKVGQRRIKGEIKPREEARRIYEAARERGQVAALLDQERPNIFTQQVANIMPGERVDIRIEYTEQLEYQEATWRFSFPMVVGPRYVPAGVEDAGAITPPVTPEGTRAGHDIALAVHLDAGAELQSLKSVLHEIETRRSGGTAELKLADKDEIPNRDFILEWSTATAQIGDALLTTTDGDAGYFAFLLQPPARVTSQQVTPRELVFVLDTSGSMSGDPINKAKETMALCLDQADPRDTFNVITFAGDTHLLFEQPVPASAQNISQAQAFLDGQRGGGGTEMMTAIRAALAPSDQQDHLRIVCFMTDGYVGNEFQILDEIGKHPNARVFSFGIGNSINTFLLDSMARAGRGEVQYVTLKDEAEDPAQRFFRRVRFPVLTDLSVEWQGVRVADVYPERVPDLFDSKPVVLRGRFTPGQNGQLVIRGQVAGEPWSRTIQLHFAKSMPEHPRLAQLWARSRVDHLMAANWLGAQRGQIDETLQQQVTALGVEYRLLTQFTSFVAVEELVVNEGGQQRTVRVPVEMPEGVSYEGVFGEGRGGAMGKSGARREARPTAPAPTALGVPTVTETELQRADMTAAEKLEMQLAARIDNRLRNLLAAAGDQAATATLEVEGVKATAGQVEVWIRLTNLEEATLAKLRELGVVIHATAKASNLAVATLPLAKLNLVALLDEVRLVEPAR